MFTKGNSNPEGHWLNTNKLPAKQTALRGASCHQAVAARSCRYGVIEGFRSLGTTTGIETIARFKRPAKQKVIHPPSGSP